MWRETNGQQANHTDTAVGCQLQQGQSSERLVGDKALMQGNFALLDENGLGLRVVVEALLALLTPDAAGLEAAEWCIGRILGRGRNRVSISMCTMTTELAASRTWWYRFTHTVPERI
jgi:hypothetical protein